MYEFGELYPGQKEALAKLKEEAKPLYTRLEYIDRIRTCYIKHKELVVCILQEESYSETGESSWALTPLRDNIAKCKELYGYDIDIPGIDLDMGKEVYYRRFMPSFVYDHVIPKERNDLMELLDKINLRYWDPFEMMCRTHALRSDQKFYVVREPDMYVDTRDSRAPFEVPADDCYEYGWLPKVLCTINKEEV